LDVMKAEPILVKGVLSFGLKSVGNSLHKLGLINLQWIPGDCEDGQAAMINAYKCYQAGSVKNNKVFKDIIKYNEVDCRMVYEIINYLRVHHNC